MVLNEKTLRHDPLYSYFDNLSQDVNWRPKSVTDGNVTQITIYGIDGSYP